MLENSIPELPPDDVIKDVTPWRKAMNRVLVGITLTIFSFNFLGMDYILPIIGAILCLLGFISLRRENRWFKYCLIITVIDIVDLLTSLILDSTIFHSIVSYPTSVLIAITVINTLLRFLLFFFLLKGISDVRRKVDLPVRVGGVVGLIVWYAVVCLTAVIQFGGSIFGIVLIIAYVFIIRSLIKFSKQLDEVGYAIKPATVRVPEWAVVTGIFAVLAVGITCGYLFFNSYPMDWQLAEVSNDAEVNEIKSELIELGFPETILEDLSDEDVKACEGAVRVVVEEKNHPVNDGRKVVKNRGDSIYITTVYDVEELKITAIAVKLSGENEEWKIFHHFLWTVDPGFYGTESIQLWPAYNNKDGWESAGDVSGHIIYDMDGQSYVASYYSLGSKTYSSNNIMNSIFYGQTATDVFAMFSMPSKGENYRGYLSYTTKRGHNGHVLYSQINYTHQRSWIQYPVKTSAENRMYDVWGHNEAFKTAQSIITFHPDKMIEP